MEKKRFDYIAHKCNCYQQTFKYSTRKKLWYTTSFLLTHYLTKNVYILLELVSNIFHRIALQVYSFFNRNLSLWILHEYDHIHLYPKNPPRTIWMEINELNTIDPAGSILNVHLWLVGNLFVFSIQIFLHTVADTLYLKCVSELCETPRF